MVERRSRFGVRRRQRRTVTKLADVAKHVLYGCDVTGIRAGAVSPLAVRGG